MPLLHFNLLKIIIDKCHNLLLKKALLLHEDITVRPNTAVRYIANTNI